MDDYTVSSLTESKNEWVVRLVNILTPLINEGFLSIFKESEKFRVGNKFSIPAAAAILIGIVSLSGWTSVNHEEMQTKLNLSLIHI